MSSYKLETPADTSRQDTICALVANQWNCDWNRMGPYSPFDVYLLKENNLTAIAEVRSVKTREIDTYATVFIDLDKWFSLMQAEIALSLRAFYIVAYPGGIWYVRIGTLPVNEYKLKYRGRTGRAKALNDFSPVVEVPSKEFKRICDSTDVFPNMEPENEST